VLVEWIDRIATRDSPAPRIVVPPSLAERALELDDLLGTVGGSVDGVYSTDHCSEREGLDRMNLIREVRAIAPGRLG
jgi:hypothetical protein